MSEGRMAAPLKPDPHSGKRGLESALRHRCP